MIAERIDAVYQQVLRRWQGSPIGEPLTSVPFPGAQANHCHDNAAAFVSTHGGTVVHGFLIEHPDSWHGIFVRPHSVVRDEHGQLRDPTLSTKQLVGQVFLPHDVEPAADFLVLAHAAAERWMPIGDPPTIDWASFHRSQTDPDVEGPF